MPPVLAALLVVAVSLAWGACSETPHAKPDDARNDTAPEVLTDGDGDGFSTKEDCDDADPDVHPGAAETPADGVDQDCDGTERCFADEDGDGHGSNSTVESPDLGCSSKGLSGNPSDCDDTDPGAHPGAEELVADATDQDCDGEELCFTDEDFDGYGTETQRLSSSLWCCEEGVSSRTGDCDDGDPSVHPEASEDCDGVDDDCDGIVDNNTWYRDSDGDLWGDSGVTLVVCEAIEGWVSSPFDCDDGDPTVHPGAFETPVDNVDQDCDGMEDCYVDLDNDGFGSARLTESKSLDCNEWLVANNDDDCDDDESWTWPGAHEMVGDGKDNDCDGSPEPPHEAMYLDLDGDGWGNVRMDITAFEEEDHLVLTAGDCDDYEATIHPDADELCNGRDDDCDGEVDESAVDAAEVEACSCEDGSDNDGDGLVDCEDGECASSPSCAETECDDGFDDDGDGLADCDDEDCWGPDCRPALIRARAMGGRMRTLVNRDRSGGSGSDFSWSDTYKSFRLELASVWGTVQTDSNTCTWSFPSAMGHSCNRRESGRLDTWTAESVQRRSFRVEGPCRLPDTPSFLPRRPIHGAYGSISPGVFYATFHWYMLEPLGSRVDRGFDYSWYSTSRGYGKPMSWWRHFSFLDGSSYLESILPGSTWTW